jgi:hypothetical protein
MNWDMLGAIGEIVGAAAVVLTLGYLARQVRATAQQDRRQQSAAMQQHFADHLALMVTDDRLPTIFMAGIRDYSSLDEEQRLRFGAWMLNVLRSQEGIFYLEREGGIVAYQEGTLASTLREVMASPGARAWWQSRREWFSADFRAEVDGWASDGDRTFLSHYDSPETS